LIDYDEKYILTIVLVYPGNFWGIEDRRNDPGFLEVLRKDRKLEEYGVFLKLQAPIFVKFNINYHKPRNTNLLRWNPGNDYRGFFG
jgi:hypothetical protein